MHSFVKKIFFMHKNTLKNKNADQIFLCFLVIFIFDMFRSSSNAINFEHDLKKKQHTRFFFPQKASFIVQQQHYSPSELCVPERRWHGKVSSARKSMLEHHSRKRNG